MGVLMLGAGLQSTLLGVRATLEGFPPPVTGMIMSCYYVGYLLGTVAAPRLLRRVGHIRVFAALAAVAAAAILVQGALVNPVTWASMRLVTGLCFAGIYVVAESWLNDRASRTNRGRLLALYMLILYAGLGGGQFLLPLFDGRSPTPFMLVSLLISLAMVPIVVSAQPLPERAMPRKVRYRDLYRNSPLGVVAVCISGLTSSIIFSMGPVYAHLKGFDTTRRGTLHGGEHLWRRHYAVPRGPAVRSHGPPHRHRRGRNPGDAGGGLHRGCCACRRGLFLLLTACFSGFALTLYSLAVSHVNDKLEQSEMVAASSALLRMNGAAAAFGPVVMGSLIQGFGPMAYFSALASLTGALTLYDLWRKMRRRAAPGDRKGEFISAEPQGLTGQIVEFDHTQERRRPRPEQVG